MALFIFQVLAVLMLIASGARCNDIQNNDDGYQELFVKQNATITIYCLKMRVNQSITFSWVLPKNSTAEKDKRLHYAEHGRILIIDHAVNASDSGAYTCQVHSGNDRVLMSTNVRVYANATCPTFDILDTIRSTLNYVSSPNDNQLFVLFSFYGNPGDLLSVEWFDSQNQSIANDPNYSTTVQPIDPQGWKYSVSFGKNTPNNGSYTLQLTLYDQACRVQATVAPRKREAPHVFMKHSESVEVGRIASVFCQVNTYPGPSTIEWQWYECPASRHRGQCVPTSTPDAIIQTFRYNQDIQFSTMTFGPAQLPGVLTCTATDDLGTMATGTDILYMMDKSAPTHVVEMGSLVRATGSSLQLTVLRTWTEHTSFVEWMFNGNRFWADNSTRVQLLAEDIVEPIGRHVNTLLIEGLKADEMGAYECKALRWDGGFTMYRWTIAEH